MKYSIKKLSLSGYSSLICIIFLISLFSYHGVNRIGESLNLVTQVDQPLATQTMLLNSQLGNLTTELGYLMISPTEKGLEAVNKNISKLNQIFDDLHAIYSKTEHVVASHVGEQILQIDRDFDSLSDTLRDVLKLVKEPDLNFPAQQLYKLHMGSAAVDIAQLYADSLDIIQELQKEAEYENVGEIFFSVNNQLNQFRQLDNSILLYLSYRKKGYLNDIDLYGNEFQRVFNNYFTKFSKFDDEDVVDNLLEIGRLFDVYYKNIGKLIDLNQRPDWRRDSHLVRTVLGPTTLQINTRLDKLVDDLNKEALNRSDEAQDIQKEILEVIIINAAISLVFSLFIACVVTRGLGRLNRVLNSAFRALGDGDMTRKIRADSIEEINCMSQSFNEHTSNICSSLSDVERIVSQVKEISADLKENSIESDLMLSQQYKDSVVAQSQIDKLASFSKEVSKYSDNSSKIAEVSKSNAFSGLELVATLSREIDALVSSFELSESKVDTLVAHSDDIQEIIKVISDISQRTGLLSLNASIEAARAGEQGLGFAVVATEVRNLSSNIESATRQISSIVERLYSSVSHTKNAMYENTLQVRTCEERVKSTLKTFSTIANAVSEIVDHSNNIREMALQQYDSSLVAKNCIAQLVHGSDCAGNRSSRLREASKGLETTSSELVQHMQKFKLEEVIVQ